MTYVGSLERRHRSLVSGANARTSSRSSPPTVPLRCQCRLGWFDRWFDSPSNHRVHHGANAAYVDRNFGSLTRLWDRMFGTYATEHEPPVYELTPQLGSNHPWDVHTAELRR